MVIPAFVQSPSGAAALKIFQTPREACLGCAVTGGTSWSRSARWRHVWNGRLDWLRGNCTSTQNLIQRKRSQRALPPSLFLPRLFSVYVACLSSYSLSQVVVANIHAIKNLQNTDQESTPVLRKFHDFQLSYTKMNSMLWKKEENFIDFQ